MNPETTTGYSAQTVVVDTATAADIVPVHPPAGVPAPSAAVALPSVPASVVYYTDSEADASIRAACLANLREVCAGQSLELVTVGRRPEPGIQIVVDGPRGKAQLWRQLVAGIEAAHGAYVYLAEHDVMYAPDHFSPARRGPGLRYNLAVVRLSPAKAYLASRHFLSQLSGPRDYLLPVCAWVRDAFASGRRNGPNDCEPGVYRGDKWRPLTYKAGRPNLDIRHSGTWTRDVHERKAPALRTVPGWGATAALQAKYLGGAAPAPARAAKATVPAVGLWTHAIIQSPLGRALVEVASKHGVTLDAHYWEDGYARRYRGSPVASTWGVKWNHGQYTHGKRAVLFLENGLLCQSSGVYVDAWPGGGLFADSAMVREREYAAPPAEADAVAAHCKTRLGLEWGGFDRQGPILVVLQTVNDAPVQYYWPGRSGGYSAAVQVVDIARRYLPDGVPVVIRPHPRDKAWMARDDAIARRLLRPGWTIDCTTPACQALRQCRGVVTVSSTLGIEALAAGLPVAVLGRHTFSGSNAVIDCSRHPEKVAKVATFAPDRDAVTRYLCAVWRHHLPYSASPERVAANPYVQRWLRVATGGKA